MHASSYLLYARPWQAAWQGLGVHDALPGHNQQALVGSILLQRPLGVEVAMNAQPDCKACASQGVFRTQYCMVLGWL